VVWDGFNPKVSYASLCLCMAEVYALAVFLPMQPVISYNHSRLTFDNPWPLVFPHDAVAFYVGNPRHFIPSERPQKGLSMTPRSMYRSIPNVRTFLSPIPGN